MAEPQTNAIDSPRRLSGRGRNRLPTSITALDIDGKLLRVVSGNRRGDGVDFTRVAFAKLELSEDERSDAAAVGKAVKKALETLRVKPSVVAMGVPRRESILRTLSLPAMADPRELAAMVQLQVARDLPYRREDAVIDFEVRPLVSPPPVPASDEAAPAAPVPQVEALVAIAQTGVVKFYQDVCAAAGVKLGALTFIPFANARCLEACGIAAEPGTVALVALRDEEVTVDIMRGGKLLFSRDAVIEEEHAHKDAKDGDSPEPLALPTPAKEQLTIVDRVTIEVVRSLHAFGGMSASATVDRISVGGGTGHEVAVAEVLSTRFSLQATVLDLSSSLKVEASERDAAPGSIAPLGTVVAVTDPAGLAFDFLAPKRPPVQRDMGRIRMLAVAAAIILLLVVGAVVKSRLVGKRLNAQKAIQQEITALNKNQPLFRRTKAQAAAVNEWLRESKNWLEHYAYLSSVLPGSEDIYITSLNIGSGGTIRLAVQARNGEVLARLDKQLRDAGYEVRPQAITPAADKHGYGFRSSVELGVPAKLKIELAKVKPPPARPADDISLTAQGRSAAGKSGSAAISVYGGGQ